MSRRASGILFLSLFVLGSTLRVLLCWSNPPGNFFDDHYGPILAIVQTGTLPAKDACFQCYHPPVFYLISAAIAQVCLHAGMELMQALKFLQYVCCFYGIATLAVCYLILKKFPLSDFSRLLAFGTICFLHRHIYMSALHSNDTIAYLFVTISIYLTLVAFERGLTPVRLGVLGIVLTLTLFTKYTAFVIIPAVIAGFLAASWNQRGVERKKILYSLVAAVALPLITLTAYMWSNAKHSGSPLPWNVSMHDPTVNRPRDKEGISYISFKPWEVFSLPILAPGGLHSFWTMIYRGMWFDTEPRFVFFLDTNLDWWRQYLGWYRGQRNFPADEPPLTKLTVLTARGLLVLGLVPLALILVGFVLCVTGRWKRIFTATQPQRAGLIMFPVLLAFNAAGIIALTMRLPIYNTIKPMYFLNSVSAFVFFLALGIAWLEKNRTAKIALPMIFGTLFALSTLHIIHMIVLVHQRSGAPI